MKVMVIHPGTQHSVKLATAIKNSNHEVTLVTTVYNTKKSLIRKLSYVLPKKEQKRLAARKGRQLDDAEIQLFGEVLGLILLLIARIDKNKKLYVRFKRMVAEYVGYRAAKMAMNEKYDVVIAFDSYARYPFDMLIKKKSSIVRVIDCSAAYAPKAKETYSKIISQYPQLEESLKAERCVIWNERYYQDMVDEAFMANYILCASNYTKHTLVEQNIKESIIHVVPYGYTKEESQDAQGKNDTGLHILYVGGVNVMKGIPYVIQAVQEVQDDNIHFTVVGNTQEIVKEMAQGDQRIEFKGYIPHGELYKEYQKADVFVFPSLSDGFGYAPLEAMSYGVPCIVTETSGISDILSDKEDGFIIRAESSDEIKQKIEWCCNNKEKLMLMGKKAKEKAKQYSEDEYKRNIGSFLARISEEIGNEDKQDYSKE